MGLTLNLMVTTVTMVTPTVMVTMDTIMANVAPRLRLTLAPTTMVIMVMVWDLSMVMVTIHTLTMVTALASGQLLGFVDPLWAKLTDQNFLPLTDKFSQIF